MTPSRCSVWVHTAQVISMRLHACDSEAMLGIRTKIGIVAYCISKVQTYRHEKVCVCTIMEVNAWKLRQPIRFDRHCVNQNFNTSRIYEFTLTEWMTTYSELTQIRDFNTRWHGSHQIASANTYVHFRNFRLTQSLGWQCSTIPHVRAEQISKIQKERK